MHARLTILTRADQLFLSRTLWCENDISGLLIFCLLCKGSQKPWRKQANKDARLACLTVVDP
jgi:hypothetical protein